MRRRQPDSLSDMYAVASTSMASVCVCVCARRGRVLPPINSSLSQSVRFLSSQHQTASVRPTPGPRPSTRQRLSVCNPKKKTGFRYFRLFSLRSLDRLSFGRATRR